MKKKEMKRAIFLMTLTFLSVSLMGQEKMSLSLQDAKAYAIEHNVTIQNAALDIKNAEASRWQSIASMLPQVSAGVDYSNMMGYKMNLGGMTIAMPPSATMTVSTAIAFTGAQVIAIQLANISKTMADITLQQSEQQITNQVESIYYSILATEESIKLLKQSQESMIRLRDMTLKSVEVGVTEETEAEKLSVQVATMDNSIRSTERVLELAYNSLRLQLAIAPDTEIELTNTLDDLVNLGAITEIMNDEFNIENNYSYKLLKESTDLSKKQISLAGWNYGPTISVAHQYSKKEYFSDEMTMNMTPPNLLAISLKVPIFSSFSNASKVKAAKNSYQKQLNTLENTEEALQLQYNQALFNLSSAMESLATQTDNVNVTQRIFDKTANKYEQGVTSSLELTNASTQLISAQSGYVQSLLDVINAKLALEVILNR